MLANSEDDDNEDWGLGLPDSFDEPPDFDQPPNENDREPIYERTCTCGKTWLVSRRYQQ